MVVERKMGQSSGCQTSQRYENYKFAEFVKFLREDFISVGSGNDA